MDLSKFHFSYIKMLAKVPPVKRKHLTAKEKKEICEKKQKFSSILNSELALDYSVKKTCISDILKQSDKWLNIDTTNKIEANRKRDHQPKWPMLDEVMRVWPSYQG